MDPVEDLLVFEKKLAKIDRRVVDIKILIESVPQDILQIENLILEIDQLPAGKERKELIKHAQQVINSYEKYLKLHQVLQSIKI